MSLPSKLYWGTEVLRKRLGLIIRVLKHTQPSPCNVFPKKIISNIIKILIVLIITLLDNYQFSVGAINIRPHPNSPQQIFPIHSRVFGKPMSACASTLNNRNSHIHHNTFDTIIHQSGRCTTWRCYRRSIQHRIYRTTIF